MMLSRAHAGSVGQVSTTTAGSVPVAAIRVLRAARRLSTDGALAVVGRSGRDLVAVVFVVQPFADWGSYWNHRRISALWTRGVFRSESPDRIYHAWQQEKYPEYDF